MKVALCIDAACARTIRSIAPRAASGAAMPLVACLGLIARTTCIALASNESSAGRSELRHVRRVSRSFVDQ